MIRRSLRKEGEAVGTGTRAGDRSTYDSCEDVEGGGSSAIRLLHVHGLTPKPSSYAQFRNLLNLMEFHFIFIYKIIQLIY